MWLVVPQLKVMHMVAQIGENRKDFNSDCLVCVHLCKFLYVKGRIFPLNFAKAAHEKLVYYWILTFAD